jgi:ankyrin repeat protein
MSKENEHNETVKSNWFKAIINSQIDVIKNIIENKIIDINTTWKYLNLGVCTGNILIKLNTALHIAILKNNFEVTKILLENEINIDTRTSEGGYAPIHLAACNESSEILELILKYIKNIDIEDQIGFTPLLLAAVYCREKNIEILIDKGSNINHREQDGDTALHFCIDKDNIICSKIFLDRGLNINVQDSHGWTCLHVGN